LTASPYAAHIDLEDLNSSQALAVLAVEPGSSVLDAAVGDGSVARLLGERGCRVVGVEAEPLAARAAESVCERVIVGDLNTLELAAALDGAKFDAVLLLDVLGQLHDPSAFLKASAGLLAPGGRVILSVHNVTHAAVRLQLLGGQFRYTDAGLLDRTQLRFFDRKGLEGLLADAGLTVLDRMRTVAGLTETEIRIDPEAFQPETVALAVGGEDAETYQFVYVVAPGDGPSTPAAVSLGEALQRRAFEAERLREQAESEARTLQARIEELEGARDRVLELEEELRRRMEELERKQDELRHLQMDIAVKDEQLAFLQAELAPRRARRARLDTALEYAGTRLRTRVGATTQHFPALHAVLQRLAELRSERRR
jgi:2-polyprenyl-3-methyl-5-hydroxy-6-metoxy-1,4-benzoquinol methylase